MYDIQHLHHICHRAFSPALTYIDTKYAPLTVSPQLQPWETAQAAAVSPWLQPWATPRHEPPNNPRYPPRATTQRASIT